MTILHRECVRSSGLHYPFALGCFRRADFVGESQTVRESSGILLLSASHDLDCLPRHKQSIDYPFSLPLAIDHIDRELDTGDALDMQGIAGA
jgi:hypothetical protein